MPVTFYAHLTWTTHQRAEVLDADGVGFLERFVPAAAPRYGARVLAIGVVPDHVHVLLRLGAVIDIPRLVQGLKGASARIANRDRIIRGAKLRWANGYDLRSVSPSGLVAATAYVLGQAERHARQRTIPAPSPMVPP